MNKRLYCNTCGEYIGDCEHNIGESGSFTKTGTCSNCNNRYYVTCDNNCCEEQNNKPYTTQLRLSEDGKSILDDDGIVIGRFNLDVVIQAKDKSSPLKLPGHLHCVNECIAWDSNGKCVRTYRNCTWVFDPM
jgi:hypothetical protein